MALEPLADNVIVQRVEAESTTPGGIVLPEISKEKPQKGMVFCVGEEVKKVKKGNVVLFPKYVGVEISVDGKEYLIMKESDIMLRIKP